MKPTIKLVLLTALRDRLFPSLYGLLAAAMGVAIYLGSWALFEPAEATVVYVAGASRALLVLGLIVFTAFHIERLYETREIEAILSRAISRGQFIAAYWLGLSAVAVLLAVPVAVVVGLFQLSGMGAAFWIASLILEAFIVVAFALFAGLTLERAIPTVFASIGFYAIARLVGLFSSMTTLGFQGGINRVANPIVDVIGYVAPRLDLFGQTRWLVYGVEAGETLTIIAVQTVLYVPFLLLAALFDLRRKHF